MRIQILHTCAEGGLNSTVIRCKIKTASWAKTGNSNADANFHSETVR